MLSGIVPCDCTLKHAWHRLEASEGQGMLERLYYSHSLCREEG